MIVSPWLEGSLDMFKDGSRRSSIEIPKQQQANETAVQVDDARVQSVKSINTPQMKFVVDVTDIDLIELNRGKAGSLNIFAGKYY